MPRYDYECPECGVVKEVQCEVEAWVICDSCYCGKHEVIYMDRIITKMPLRTYTKRPQDRLWGTSHLSSSEKFREKQKRKGEK